MTYFVFISSLFVESIFATLYNLSRAFTISAFVAYLPSFFDGSEITSKGRPHPLRENQKWGKSWFPSKDCFLKFDDQIPDPQKQYIVLLSPHGVLSMGHWFLNTCEFHTYFGGNDRRRSLGGDVVFSIPFYRDMMLAGGIVSASAKTCEACLDDGYTVVVLPGGIVEQVMTKYGEQAIYIKKRKGIFKYALKYNLPIVPIYSMNEVNMTHTSDFLQNFRNYLAKSWWFPVFLCSPKIDTKKIACYGGNSIQIKMAGDEPTNEEIEQLQQMYIDEVQRIYKKYKDEWGYTQTEIKIL
jgi:hypothetical protein